MDRWQTSSLIPADAHGPAFARQLVGVELDHRGLGPLAADAQLLVSELVTNAHQHAPGPESYELEISADENWVRFSLADGSLSSPVLADVTPEKTRGRGILLVDMIASRWGTEPYRDGKRVWAEIPR